MPKAGFSLFVITLFTLFGCSNVVTKNKKVPLHKKCIEKAIPGPCKAFFPSFFFDGNQCRESYWGGCEGNRPFKTFKACQKKCH